jgi:hypothetical protein
VNEKLNDMLSPTNYDYQKDPAVKTLQSFAFDAPQVLELV